MSMRVDTEPRHGEQPVTHAAAPHACPGCLRSSWLLMELSARLELRGRDLERLLRLFELPDRELIYAVGGHDRKELLARHAEFDPLRVRRPHKIQTVCRHDARHPLAHHETAGAPRALHLLGTLERFSSLLAEPVVVIAGTAFASDYGLQMARSLARGLAASGVTVASGLATGIPAAAHVGALDVDGPTFTVMAGGVDVCRPAGRRTLYERLGQTGCVLSELPCGFAPRRWCDPMRSRLLVALASMVIVVEARARPHELALAQMARAAGKIVAAVPGRVTSTASAGTHVLLMQGAELIRDPQDALDALYGVGVQQAPVAERKLGTGAQGVLEQLGLGRDTLPKLTAAGANRDETLLALAELELHGAAVRGDGGRYVPAHPIHDG
ncbi:MAG TPA: DNA-processing protein DprA [Solirubrobacteraceae bacterium]|nr:DNA-processing protein DprA [Solirubrobacteraceae bacterium]